MAESRWDSRRGDGQRATLGIPRGETAIAHHQRRFHAHNGSSPASFPCPQTPKALSPPSIARPRSEWGHDPFWARPPTPKALCHKARGCAVPGATPGSGRSAFPTPQGVVPVMPTGGAVNKDGMGSGSRVPKRSPPGMYVHYPRNTHTSHTTHSPHRHNHLRGCGALRTHTPGNAAGGATPGFGAESRWDSRRGKARADGHSTRLQTWPAMDSHRHPNRPIQPSWWRHPQPPRLCSRRDRKLCPQG